MADPITLPPKPGEALTCEQVKLERAAITRYRVSAISYIAVGVALISAAALLQNFLEGPYVFWGLLVFSIVLAVLCLTMASISVSESETAHNRLDNEAIRQRRGGFDLRETVATWSIAGSGLFLGTFVALNIAATVAAQPGKIDIVASKYLVEAGEVVLLSVEGVDGDSFEWAVSAGTLLDNDERSVALLVPTNILAAQNTILVRAIVEVNDRYFEEETTLILKELGSDASLRYDARAIHFTSFVELPSQRISNRTDDIPPLLPNPGLPYCDQIPAWQRYFFTACISR